MKGIPKPKLLDRIAQALGFSTGGKLSKKQLLKMASNIQSSAEKLGYGDEVKQWVSTVTNFSSQYDSSSWCARQVEGSPKVYPNYGDIAGAWAMGDIDSQQFIELEFDEPVYITGLDIYETYHAGGVKAVFGRELGGKWQKLWKTEQVQVIQTARIFSPPIQDPGFQIKQIRIEVDCTRCGTWVEIDAVQMRGKKYRSEPPPSLDMLAEDYKKLVNDETFSDVEFRIGKQIVYAHKVILSARCDYFRAMFQHDMKESSRKCIDMPDVSYHSFLGMMYYLYCNNVPNDFDCISLTELWRVADRYSIDALKKYASFTISMKLDSSNVVDIYVDAVTKLPIIEEVKKTCLMYMSSNMDKVVVSPRFADLPQDLMLEIVQATTAKLSLTN